MSQSNPQTAFEATAQRAERLAREHPGRYRLLLLGYGLLGYVVIFAMLFGLIGIVVGLGMLAVKSTALLVALLKKKLIFLIIPVIWVLLTALWVRLRAPDGYRADRSEFPELFATIDSLCEELDTPRIHEVVLTPELNAAIVQTPRLGIFGWYRNTLVLGIELLLVLSPEQARAVIAHELGHLSGNHSRFAGWIYRVRQSWDRIMNEFSVRDGLGAGLMARFFEWYAPRFAAFSFALARQNEYEADRISAELTDAPTAAAALVNVHVRAPHVDSRYWARFYKQADTLPEPPHLPWSGLVKWLAITANRPQDLEEGLNEVLEQTTSYADTHPCLADRLRALGQRPVLPEPARTSAAATWLGRRFESVVADFDREWREHNSAHWKHRFEYAQQSRQKLAAWQSESPSSMEDAALWERACLVAEFQSEDAARELYSAYQARHPDDPDAALVLGRMAWDRPGDELLQQMRIAIQSPRHAQEAFHYAYHFLSRHDRLDESDWWIERAEAQARITAESRAEREQVSVDDRLIAPTISVERMDDIASQLAASGKLKKAWLAQKRVKYDSDVPALVIAVAGKGFFVDEDALQSAVAESLSLDCTCFIVPRAGDYKKLANKVIEKGVQILP